MSITWYILKDVTLNIEINIIDEGIDKKKDGIEGFHGQTVYYEGIRNWTVSL